MNYKYKIIQKGSLPVHFDGRVNHNLPHRSTSTLVYREINNEIDKAFLLLVDPGWVLRSEMEKAAEKLRDLKIDIHEINYLFLTHSHYDHRCGLRYMKSSRFLKSINPQFLIKSGITQLEIIQTPGHSYDSRSLIIHSDKKIAIVGDAIINNEYLELGGYYYPNNYNSIEIKITRQTMRHLIDQYDVIIPGHGDAIIIDNKRRNLWKSYKFTHK